MAQPTYLELLTRHQAAEQYVSQELRDEQVASDVRNPQAETHVAVSELVAAGGLTWEGSWSVSQLYQYKDVVEYQGSSWIAERATQGEEPSNSSTAWDLFAAKGDPGISGAGTAADWQLLYGRNNTPVSIGSTPALTAVVEGQVARATALTVTTTAVIEVTTGGVLEGWYMLDTNNRVANDIKQTLVPGWYTLSHAFVQRQVQEGDFYLDFYLQFPSGGAGTIAYRKAEVSVQSGAILGGASNLRPNFFLEDIISPEFDFSPSLTDSATLTLLTPISISGEDTVEPTFDFSVPIVDELRDDVIFFSLDLDIVGTVVTATGGLPDYVYDILIDGGLAGTFTTDSSGENVTDYASVFALSSGSHTVKIIQTGQTFTVEVA